MRRLLLLIAFAMGLAGTAPATAQTMPAAGQALSPEMQAFVDAVTTSVGESDRIHLYAEIGPTVDTYGSGRFMVRFVPPGVPAVRTFRGNLEPLTRTFFPMVRSARAAGQTWRVLNMVIDHGNVSISYTEPGDLPEGGFTARLAAATARVFPGMTIEPKREN